MDRIDAIRVFVAALNEGSLAGAGPKLFKSPAAVRRAIAFLEAHDSWSFPPTAGSTIPRAVQFTPRFVVNSIRAAVASAVQGRGVVRMFSYHLSDAVADGTLKIILADDEHAPLPVHLVSPHGRLSVPKVRAFVDFALPKLREGFEELTRACSAPGATARTR